jgi:hypothetical protein
MSFVNSCLLGRDGWRSAKLEDDGRRPVGSCGNGEGRNDCEKSGSTAASESLVGGIVVATVVVVAAAVKAPLVSFGGRFS